MPRLLISGDFIIETYVLPIVICFDTAISFEIWFLIFDLQVVLVGAIGTAFGKLNIYQIGYLLIYFFSIMHPKCNKNE